jgi:hypothetical protein
MDETDTSATTDAGSRTGAIAGILGGALLVVGSFMTWATASVNLDRIAEAFGVDPSLLQGAVGGIATSRSITGTGAGDGWITVIAGLVVIGGVALAVAARKVRLGGVLMVVGGVVGGAVALYDATKVKGDAIDEITGALGSQGLPGNVADFFTVHVGVGLWMCLVGGVVGVAGAIWIMTRAGDASASSPLDPTVVPASGVSTERSQAGSSPPAPVPVPVPPMPAVGGPPHAASADPERETPPPGEGSAPEPQPGSSEAGSSGPDEP